MAKDGETNDGCALEHEGRASEQACRGVVNIAEGRWMWDSKECDQDVDHF